MNGVVREGRKVLRHRITSIVTDMTKVVDRVRVEARPSLYAVRVEPEDARGLTNACLPQRRGRDSNPRESFRPLLA